MKIPNAAVVLRGHSHSWRRAPTLAAMLIVIGAGCLVNGQTVQAGWPGTNGKIVFWKFSGSLANPHAQIYSMDSSGSNQTNLSAAGGGADALNIQPSVSPNGKRIAFTRVTTADFVTFTDQIWTMKMDGSDQTNVSKDSGVASETEPAWSEDGSKILFVRQGPGSPPFGGFGSIWIRKANGTGTPRQLTSGPDANPTMSPDGDRIAFTRLVGIPPNFVPHLFVMKADGSEGPTDLGVVGAKPDWSPDSTRLVYGQGGTGPIMVVTVSDPSQNQQLAGFGNEAPAWSPDGTQIVFLHCFGPMACDVAVMSADGQDQHTITSDVSQGTSDQKPDWQRANGAGGEKG